MKIIKITLLSLLSVTLLTACGTGEQGAQDDVAVRRVSDPNQNTVNNGGSNADNGGNIPGNNGSTAGDQEENIVGNGGTNGTGGTTGNGNTDGTGGTTGNNGNTGDAGALPGGNGDGQYTADNEGKVAQNNGDIRIADKAQNKVENLKEVSHASVIVVNNKAYVGVLMDNHQKDGLTKEIKKKISDAVKSTDKKVEKVYTSSNPEVIERMGEYGDKVQNNESVKGLSGEFTDAMKKFFPDAG